MLDTARFTVGLLSLAIGFSLVSDRVHCSAAAAVTKTVTEPLGQGRSDSSESRSWAAYEYNVNATANAYRRGEILRPRPQDDPASELFLNWPDRAAKHSEVEVDEEHESPEPETRRELLTLSEERAVLLTFYSSLGGPNWTIRTGWGSAADVSTWYGVGVENGHVAVLWLPDNNLAGTLPDLSGLTFLRSLELRTNRITGSIPESYGSLPAMQRLSLWSNQLSGTIPTGLDKLSNLEYLYLFGNFLTGTIPSTFGTKLVKLRSLWLYGNSLTGPIPVSLASLPQLEEVLLGFNELSGGIPLFGQSSMRYFSVGRNFLSGGIPTTFGNMINLYFLELNDNSLSGSIPAGVLQLKKLEYVSLARNGLSGKIPPIGKLNVLTNMYLQYNQLTGAIPKSVGTNLITLRILDIGANKISGTIPSTLGRLTYVQELWFGTNQLSGIVPAAFGNLGGKALRSLDLRTNPALNGNPGYLANPELQTYLTALCPSQPCRE